MLEYKSTNGQSLMDICLSTYGNLDFMLKLIQDNSIPNINYRPVSGQVFLWDETINIDETVNRVSHNGNVAYCTGVPQKDVVPVIETDLDILRQIRDANPASQLPTLWPEAKDPYTEWAGVIWNDEKTLVTELNVTGKSVSTLNAVKKLTGLRLFQCAANQITELDLSGMTNLVQIVCYSNPLTSLNIAGLPELRYIYANNCQLASLNVSGLTSLIYLYVNDNLLTALDVTGIASLKYLRCFNNQLTSLIVTGTTILEEFFCHNNLLPEIYTLTSRENITNTSLAYNKMNTQEINRILSIGFTEEEIGKQNP